MLLSHTAIPKGAARQQERSFEGNLKQKWGSNTITGMNRQGHCRAGGTYSLLAAIPRGDLGCESASHL